MEIYEKERNIWDYVFEYRSYVLLFLGGCLFTSLFTSIYLKNLKGEEDGRTGGDEFTVSESEFQSDSGGENTGGILGKQKILNSGEDLNQVVSTVKAEIVGSVKNPSVYEATEGARVSDLILLSGGYSANADISWISRNLNLAEKLIDGMKVYIPKKGEFFVASTASSSTANTNNSTSSNSTSQNSNLTNVNVATLAQLDTLPGIGPVYGQKIIDNRPYKNFEELVAKSGVGKGVLDKIKQLITF